MQDLHLWLNGVVMSMVACIIPARDEAARVGAVVRAVTSSPLIDQVVVVDNASSDDTAVQAARAGAEVISCLTIGKYEALAAGVAYASEADALLFLDADLKGLTCESIATLLAPVLSGDAPMVLGVLHRPRLLRIFLTKYWAGLTGQRSLRREAWEALPGGHGFEVEALLNSICRKRSWPLPHVELLGVTHIGKRDKFPPGRAMIEYLRGYGSGLRAYIRTLSPKWGK